MAEILPGVSIPLKTFQDFIYTGFFLYKQPDQGLIHTDSCFNLYSTYSSEESRITLVNIKNNSLW